MLCRTLYTKLCSSYVMCAYVCHSMYMHVYTCTHTHIHMYKHAYTVYTYTKMHYVIMLLHFCHRNYSDWGQLVIGECVRSIVLLPSVTGTCTLTKKSILIVTITVFHHILLFLSQLLIRLCIMQLGFTMATGYRYITILYNVWYKTISPNRCGAGLIHYMVPPLSGVQLQSVVMETDYLT